MGQELPRPVLHRGLSQTDGPARPQDPPLGHQGACAGHGEVCYRQVQGGIALVGGHAAIGGPIGHRVQQGGVDPAVDAAKGVAVAGFVQVQGQAAVVRLDGLKAHAQQGKIGGPVQQVHEGLDVLGVQVGGRHRAPLHRTKDRRPAILCRAVMVIVARAGRSGKPPQASRTSSSPSKKRAREPGPAWLPQVGSKGAMSRCLGGLFCRSRPARVLASWGQPPWAMHTVWSPG